ncbi:four helix bundle protein [Prolixibacter denitrificans]|uniref:Four helix bundle protein n=1 Tax=Prolixibacter denitrificans TaxID=1541063 RepID=A0A2P8C8Q1_9BACT|nr:four helix bundle protein [Prolixibacter denitrificans]PSK81329.1 four helix bundle protein [Prolixibacter denitrificans]GET21586.1 hypothetical protein JCM18694_18320 [Prolixibacter denitrificans]
MNSFRELTVWQQSMILVEEVYKITKQFPNDETFGLTSQMRRAAVSIPSNIAEGYMRKNTKEYIHFLYIALASLGELDTQIEIADRLKYFQTQKELTGRITEIRQMLYGLIQALKRKI